MEDAKRGKYSNCKKMLIFQGYTEHEAETACGHWLDSVDKSDEFNILFVDEEDSDKSCVSRKIHIFANEHPKWSHDKVVAAAHGYCGLSKDVEDAIDLSNVLVRSKSLSLSRFATLIKNIKIKVGLKVGAMGILPQLVEMPMKNINRLQTKLEKFITAEQAWLTSEEFLKRSRYARFIRKKDADEEFDEDYEMSDEEFTDSITRLYNEIVEYYPLNTPEDAIERAFELPEGDNAWIMSNEAEIISMNDGLNNIIKAPIILAREMVQRYTNEDGIVEYHFKPYHELKRAAERARIADQLDIIIEHQDWYDSDQIMGHVKEIRADDKSRSIKGICYFHESKLPEGLRKMIKDKEIIPVSIGFLAKLGKGGTFNNQAFNHTQEHIVLRHLAIILDSVARCPAGVCGINLVDSKNEKNKDNIKNFIIIKKENYYLNICKIIADSKKETNKNQIKKPKKVETMQEDSNMPKNQPSDFEVILSKLQAIIQEGKVPIEEISKKILAALGIKKKSDSNMDEKEFKDALDKKDSIIEEITKSLSDSKKENEKLTEIVRENYIKAIKKFGDKYSDEELKEKDLPKLIEIADAVSRFTPSTDKPDVIPVAPKDDKKKMEDEVEKGERVNPYTVFDDVKKEFNMAGL